MRPVNYFTYNLVTEFLASCEIQFTVLHNDYGYYYCDLCNRINDIEELLKKKKDYHNHRCNVYYIDDECYFVSYLKNTIEVYVLLDCCGPQVAHKLVDVLKKINVKKEEKIEPW